MKILGIFHSYSDPSAALFVNGELVAFAEEERFNRIKHASGGFPIRAIDYVLSEGKIELTDVDFIAHANDTKKYDDGTVAKHYESINKQYPTDDSDLAYQKKYLNVFKTDNQKELIYKQLRKHYGDQKFPEIRFVPHHLAHACTAYFTSGLKESLVLTIDGSGEEITTAWWHGKGNSLKLLREVKVPHSLGWFYSGFTEYLGFDAYDGEYKVMGLAAYGKEDKTIAEKIDQIVWYDNEGGFSSNPMLLSRGKRSHSYYYPDSLPEFMGKPPRARREPLEEWHKNCGFIVQKKLESIVFDMVKYWTERTGIRDLCISGGVGLNVKMNGNLYASGLVDELFVYPLCSDAGQSIGAAMAALYEDGKLKNEHVKHLYYGPGYSDAEAQQALTSCKLAFTVEQNIEKKVAELLSEGKIVGWVQSRMEGGPRALGARSILADPRDVSSRDRVNAIIKYREMWRPFCPSMTPDGAKRYLVKHTNAPFMILTFTATEAAKKEAPAIVHVDGTCRPQVIEDDGTNTRYYNLIKEFEKKTGVPALLNTSFNVKGEPIVCTPHDAIRTFSATGLDALVLGNCLVLKPNRQS